jgi:hypothetical protein
MNVKNSSSKASGSTSTEAIGGRSRNVGEAKTSSETSRHWSWSAETSQWDWMDYHEVPIETTLYR